MADETLLQQTELGTSEDGSFIHIVQNGNSYKQQKSNFLKEDRANIESKLLKSTYTGNAQDLYNSINSIAFESVKTYQTLALLNAVVSPTLNDSAKVANDSTPANNGYYGYNGTIWVKNSDLYENSVDEKDTSAAVSGLGISEFTNYKNKFAILKNGAISGAELDVYANVIDFRFRPKTYTSGDDFFLRAFNKVDGLFQIRNRRNSVTEVGVNLVSLTGIQEYYIETDYHEVYLKVDWDGFSTTGFGVNDSSLLNLQSISEDETIFNQNKASNFDDKFSTKSAQITAINDFVNERSDFGLFIKSALTADEIDAYNGILEFKFIPNQNIIGQDWVLRYFDKATGIIQVRDLIDSRNITYTIAEARTGIQEHNFSTNIGSIYFKVDWDKITAGYSVSNPQGIGVNAYSDERKTFLSSNVFYNTIFQDSEILWLGTSIPEGSSYPSDVCGALGATLTNEALGSSPVRIPDLAETPAWQSYTRALSHTIVEKQSIIDNWATVRLSLSNTPPATLDAPEQARILGASYENKITPYLGTADYIFFDHAFNDHNAASPNDVFTIPATRDDRSTFIGAMNYLLDIILTNDFRQKVYFIGHYENYLKDGVCQAQEVIASLWGYPLIKTWEKTGISDQIINGNTVLNNWIPDGVHPYTDLTGQTEALIAKIIINDLRIYNI